jgi:hypothetical protein
LKQRGPKCEKKKFSGGLKNGSKCSLWSSYFINDSILVPQYFKILIRVQKFIFQFLIWERREKAARIWLMRESRLTPILAMKNINFGVNRFHSTRRFYLRSSFPFILPEIVDQTLRNFLFLGWFWFFDLFFRVI